jgi:gamma-glutamylcyclotransferase (GGCT)/AIG2-like uncharacterized protein YtfP
VSEPSRQRLFVYGSLRSDLGDLRPIQSKAAYTLLVGKAVSEGPASVAGRLYAPAWYPGYVPDVSGQVRGEVWAVEDPGVLSQLDVFEGEPYVRDRCEAWLEDGRQVTAWTYRYVADIAGVPLIPSGDYLDWVRKR